MEDDQEEEDEVTGEEEDQKGITTAHTPLFSMSFWGFAYRIFNTLLNILLNNISRSVLRSPATPLPAPQSLLSN